MEFIKPIKYGEEFKTIEELYLFVVNLVGIGEECEREFTIEDLELVIDNVRESILKGYPTSDNKELTIEQLKVIENNYIDFFNCGLLTIKNNELYFYSPLHFQYINIHNNVLATLYAKTLSLHWFN